MPEESKSEMLNDANKSLNTATDTSGLFSAHAAQNRQNGDDTVLDNVMVSRYKNDF